jgi:hypothetical protein
MIANPVDAIPVEPVLERMHRQLHDLSRGPLLQRLANLPELALQQVLLSWGAPSRMVCRRFMDLYGHVTSLRPCVTEDVCSAEELLAQLQALPRLQHVKAIDFSLVSSLVDDDVVKAAISASTSLEHLSLHRCAGISAAALSDLAEAHADTLRSFVAPPVSPLWDFKPGEDIAVANVLSQLSALEFLEVASYETGRYIQAASNLSRLTKLSLGAFLAERVGASDVLAAAARLPALLDLRLPKCHTWDTTAVHLLRSLQSLTALQIGGDVFTPPGAVVSAIAALRNLKELALVDPVIWALPEVTQLSSLHLQSLEILWHDDWICDICTMQERGLVLSLITPSWPLTRLLFTSDAQGIHECCKPVFDGDQLLPALHRLQSCLRSLQLVDAVVPRHLFTLLRQLGQLQLLLVHNCVYAVQSSTEGNATSEDEIERVPMEDLAHFTGLTSLLLGSLDYGMRRGADFHEEVPTTELACLTALRELSLPHWHPDKEELCCLLPLQQLQALTIADLDACPMSWQEACGVLQHLGSLNKVITGPWSEDGYHLFAEDVQRLGSA